MESQKKAKLRVAINKYLWEIFDITDDMLSLRMAYAAEAVFDMAYETAISVKTRDELLKVEG